MLAYGTNLIREVIKSNHKINEVIIKEGFNDKEILSLLNGCNAKRTTLKKEEFSRKYAQAKQGLVLDIEDYKYYDLDELIKNHQNNSVVLMLDSLEDPHNLGAIIRSFDASGGDFIIIPKNNSVSLNETVAKVSTGSINYVKIAQVTNLNQTIKKLKENGYWVVGTEMNAKIDYTKIDSSVPLCIVIGNEGFGISRLVKENCDYLVNIPMVGTVNSLNASVAASIILFDIMMRRK